MRRLKNAQLLTVTRINVEEAFLYLSNYPVKVEAEAKSLINEAEAEVKSLYT
ncbi:hypothetical protein HanPI659440_Chr07g0275621 [Helianthus annuus]|nr:hypothetical protein HanPI659440_Chr07g0275621 [Helianthus annuus]